MTEPMAREERSRSRLSGSSTKTESSMIHVLLCAAAGNELIAKAFGEAALSSFLQSLDGH